MRMVESKKIWMLLRTNKSYDQNFGRLVLMAMYEPMPREYHISALVGSKVLVYSGRTEDESVQNKKRLQSVVEVYDPCTERWEAQQCTGTAPVAGLYNTACLSSNDVVYTYGGRDGDRNLVNSLHQLSSDTYRWSLRSTQNVGGDSPIPKCGTAMAACGDDLALLGGFGVLGDPIQCGSSFVGASTYVTDVSGWTNEFHVYRHKEGMHTCKAY